MPQWMSQYLSGVCIVAAGNVHPDNSDEIYLAQLRYTEVVAASGEPPESDDEAPPNAHCEAYGSELFDQAAFIKSLQMEAEKADPDAEWSFAQGQCQYRYARYNIESIRRRYKSSYEYEIPPHSEQQHVPCANVAAFCARSCAKEESCMGFSVILQRTMPEYAWCNIMHDKDEEVPAKLLPAYYPGSWVPDPSRRRQREYPDRSPHGIYTADGASTTFCMGRPSGKDAARRRTPPPTPAPTVNPSPAPTQVPTLIPSKPTEKPYIVTTTPAPAPPCVEPSPTPAPTSPHTPAPTPDDCRPQTGMWFLCDSEEPSLDWTPGLAAGELKFTNIGTIKGYAVDLIVTPTTEFWGKNEQTGKHDCFGVFNIDAGKETAFELKLVHTNTNSPIVAEELYFEWHDFDHNKEGKARESVEILDQSELVHIGTQVRQDGNSFTSTSFGNFDDNPSNTTALETVASERMIRLKYSQVSKISVKLGVTSTGKKNKGGRNFLFAFTDKWC